MRADEIQQGCRGRSAARKTGDDADCFNDRFAVYRPLQALGYQLIKQGFIVLYRSIFDGVRDFLQDEAMVQTDRILAKYLKPDLLIIDDMGMKQLPKRSGEYLFEIIMRRYEVRSTIMTSNRPIEE